MILDRRLLLTSLVGGTALGPWLALEAAAQTVAAQPSSDPHARLAAVPGLKMRGDEQIAMLLYPGFTALDLVGPHYFFSCMMGAKVHLVTNQQTLAPVRSDLGLAIEPTVSMNDVPRDLTLVFAPGGTTGTLAAMEDKATLAFLADRGTRAEHITSVCTGSLLLAAAGLLKGKRATSHWVSLPVLAEFGAVPVDERVVTDGKVTTGAGVSAGLDFAIALVERLRGRPYAQALMYQAQYAPEPPVPGGTSATTPPDVGGAITELYAPVRERFQAVARRSR